MIEKQNIEKLINNYLKDTTFFLVSIKVDQNNNIKVVLDGDEGININECISVSRHIEAQFDREKEDYSLDVSSPGLTKPLRLIRQCNKYLNKNIEIYPEEEKPFKAILKKINGEQLFLESTPDKKKKETKHYELKFSEINKILPIITFDK